MYSFNDDQLALAYTKEDTLIYVLSDKDNLKMDMLCMMRISIDKAIRTMFNYRMAISNN